MQPPLSLTHAAQPQLSLNYDGSTYAELRTDADGLLGVSAPMLSAHAVASGNQFAKAEIFWDEDETTRAGLFLRGTPDELGWHHAKVISDRDATLFSYASYLGFYIEGKASGTTDTSAEWMRLTFATPTSAKLVLGGPVNGGNIEFAYPALGTYFGVGAGAGAGATPPAASTYNTLFGYEAGNKLTGDGSTGGRWNCYGGFQTGKNATATYGNAGWGMQVLQDATTAFDCTAVGIHSQLHLVDGSGNASVGGGSLQNGLHTTESVAVGMYAGRDFDGDRGIFIGSRAGMYESADDTLIIDNQDRGSEANGRSKGMFYGLFHADPAQQKLVINAGLFYLPHIPTSSAGLTSGRIWNDSGTLKVIP